MKTALVHDQLQEFGGAERVFIALKKIFPNSDVFTSFYNRETIEKNIPDWKKWKIKTSWASRIPFFGKLYSPLRFLAPSIWESFDFSNYDLVISSSGWFMCKGIKTKKPTVHICYLHHNPRYLYGYETAVEWQKYWPVKIYAHIINHFLRIWDYESSQRPDYFVVNSEETKRRVKKFYRRDSTVIYPPVQMPERSVILNSFQDPKKMPKQVRHDINYYVTVSRLAKAKHIDLLIKAANKMKFKLKIVGIGRDEEYLKSISGPTVEFLGNISDKEFTKLYSGAKAFLFSSVDEEFGIAPVEAMGYGVPVIAYKSGGLIETVKDGVNGYLFDQLNKDSLIEKIKLLEKLSSDQYISMRKQARQMSENYSEEKFEERILKFVNSHARTSRG